jgi:DNA transformation protein
MKPLPEFINYFLFDCLWWDDSFSTKAMFSGYWIYKNQKIFAIYWMWELYFKVWKNNLDDYIKYNSRKFEYRKKWKLTWISYYTLPEDILEDRNKLDKWIEKSLEVKK